MARKSPPPLTSEQRSRVVRIRDEAFDDPSRISQLESAEELHFFAAWYRRASGEGFDALRQLLLDPRTDRGTALAVYWRIAVNALTSDERLTDGLSDIERRLESGFFRTQRIAFDPGFEPEDELWIHDHRVPREMMLPTPGVTLDTDPFDHINPRAFRHQMLRRPLSDERRALLLQLERRPNEEASAYAERLSIHESLLLEEGLDGVATWLHHRKVAFDSLYRTNTRMGIPTRTDAGVVSARMLV